jgi:hypothetical protein
MQEFSRNEFYDICFLYIECKVICLEPFVNEKQYMVKHIF